MYRDLQNEGGNRDEVVCFKEKKRDKQPHIFSRPPRELIHY